MQRLDGVRALVTGGNGFLGSRVVVNLRAMGATVLAPSSKEYDLRQCKAVQSLFRLAKYDIVYHLAGKVGGIGETDAHGADFFYDNIVMGTHVIKQCVTERVPKVIVAGSVCAYPEQAPVPFEEKDLWSGEPEKTNGPYGTAKRALHSYLQACKKQYNLRYAYLLPTNLYGPGDNFSPTTSHVIPALIRKFTYAVETKQETVILWGSGKPTRDFLFVDDAAQAFTKAAFCEDDSPINIGSGQEVSIFDLAHSIAVLTGYTGAILWDTSKPDGQARRVLDCARAKRLLEWEPRTPLSYGLPATIAWWQTTGKKEWPPI